MERAQKQKVVDTLRAALSETTCVVITRQSGLTVAEVTQLRRQMRGAGAGFRVTKNRLARRALAGTRFEPLSPLFTGPTAIAFSRDPVAAAKITVEFANRNTKLTIVGGLAGRQIDADGVRELASLPSLDELRGRLIGLLSTPASRVAVVLQAPAGQLARLLNAHADAPAEHGEAEPAVANGS